MTSREQFEAWLRTQPHVLNVGIEPDGTYTLHEDRVAWAAWQASREALEVELPEEMTLKEAVDKGLSMDYSSGYTDAVIECRKVVISAGIKVKQE